MKKIHEHRNIATAQSGPRQTRHDPKRNGKTPWRATTHADQMGAKPQHPSRPRTRSPERKAGRDSAGCFLSLHIDRRAKRPLHCTEDKRGDLTVTVTPKMCAKLAVEAVIESIAVGVGYKLNLPDKLFLRFAELDRVMGLSPRGEGIAEEMLRSIMGDFIGGTSEHLEDRQEWVDPAGAARRYCDLIARWRAENGLPPMTDAEMLSPCDWRQALSAAKTSDSLKRFTQSLSPATLTADDVVEELQGVIDSYRAAEGDRNGEVHDVELLKTMAAMERAIECVKVAGDGKRKEAA